MTATDGTVPFATDDDVRAASPAAVAHLRRGGVLAHPTETVYGLGCMLGARALRRLCTLKPREPGKPFVVVIAGLDMLDLLDVTLPEPAARLARAFWPGALTMVLPGTGRVPAEVRNDDGGVAVRWTSHAALSGLVRALGTPITSTSANRPGLPPMATAQEIVRTWQPAVAAGDLCVLDGGRATTAAASTVIDCAVPVLRVIRSGAVSGAELAAVVPGIVGEE